MIDGDLTAWVDGCLAGTSRTRTGDLALVRDRAWATVHRVPTSAGPVWLKVTTPRTVAELGVYAVLAQTVPDRVLEPLGLDPGRGWLLLPDGGTPAGERFAGADLVAVMTHALRRYARLQLDLAPHVDALLARGVPDMRPAVMPQRFDEAVAGLAGLVATRGTPADRAAFARLPELRPAYVSWCAELAGSDIPASLDHNDLHARNVLGTGGPEDFAPRFYDWGDSVVAHPFASLLLVLDTLPADARDAVRAAYLAEFGDPAALRAQAELAVRVGRVARALVWERALGSAEVDDRFAAARIRSLLRLVGSSPHDHSGRVTGRP